MNQTFSLAATEPDMNTGGAKPHSAGLETLSQGCKTHCTVVALGIFFSKSDTEISN